MVVSAKKRSTKEKKRKSGPRSTPVSPPSPLAAALKREQRCNEHVAKWVSSVPDSPEADEYELQLWAYVNPGRYARFNDLGQPVGCAVSGLVVDRRPDKRSSGAFFVVVDFEDVDRPSPTIVPLAEFIGSVNIPAYQGPRYRRIGDFESET